MQTVKIKAHKSGPLSRSGTALVEPAQPVHKGKHVSIAPHPARETVEVTESLEGIGIFARFANEAMNTVGVRPVAFNGYEIEAFLLDQPPGDQRALAIEVMRAMRSLSDQNHAPPADPLQQRVVVAGVGCQR